MEQVEQGSGLALSYSISHTCNSHLHDKIEMSDSLLLFKLPIPFIGIVFKVSIRRSILPLFLHGVIFHFVVIRGDLILLLIEIISRL